MPKVNVLNLEGQKTSTRDLPADVFDVTAKPVVIANAVRYYRTRMRGATAATKTRDLVRGSGRKMWAQKHTGRARHADAQAPQFRGGGRAHGPKPHRASIHFPHRMRRLALRAVLSDKIRNGDMLLIALPEFERPSSKMLRGFPHRAGLTSGKILFVFETEAQKAYRSARNLPNSRTCRALSLTAYDVLSARNLVLTEKAADLLTMRLTEAGRG